MIEPPTPDLLSWPTNGVRLTRLDAVLFFGSAALVAAAMVFLVLKLNLGIAMDSPDSRRKFHEKAVPRLGGGPIFLTLCLGTLAAWMIDAVQLGRWLPVAICSTLIFSVGFVDDLKPLGARVKLVGQLGTAMILYSMGVSMDVLSSPFGDGSISLGWMALPLTLLWLVAIPNIVNLIDGMDGLAGGFGMFLCLTMAFIGHYQGQVDVAAVSLTMAGALGGFLIFNLPPAKIFLGDGGAYLIGFFIASVSLLSSNKGSVIGALLVVIIALGVPILDTTFTILRRAIRGVPIFRADAEHIHHRLILLGFSKGRALVAMYTMCLLLSLAGISILLTKGLALPVTGAILFLLALAGARYLGYVRSFGNLRQQLRETLERRRMREYFRACGRVLDFEVERSPDIEGFERSFLHAIERMNVSLQPGPDRAETHLDLSAGRMLVLHHPKDRESPTEWRLRLDELLPSLEGCLARWQRLPECLMRKLIQPAPPAPSGTSASSQTAAA
jgi:UDP-GlcNAc:undecaprenyl-phosphate GlcNAc-1-phosphate transferase